MYLISGIPRAIRNLRRNWHASLNSILIVASSLALLGMVGLLYVNVVHISEIWLSNTTVSLFLKPSLGERQRRLLLRRVQDHPLVARAVLVSPEEGLRSLAAKLGADNGFLTGAEKGGLPYTIDFEVFVDYRKRIGSLAESFDKFNGVEEVVYAERVLGKAKLFFDLTKGLGVFFAGMILISFCLIIANAARLSLYSRRQEIEILHLSGATRGYIRSAFVVEGVLLALIGWALALVLVWFAFQLVIAGLTWNDFTRVLKQLSVFFPWEVLVGALLVLVGLGALSSYLAVNRVLKAIEP
ncbi:MAG: permease-like cell division protein FtsX [SAR324 cluster bacterium]|nr:permease-like cell division protein FtsX [SAR324 cluster bacterium]